jgi:hypothetical protein
MRRPIAALMAAAAVAALAGCSGQAANDSSKDFHGDQKAVAQVIDDLGNAGKKGDGQKICNEILAPALVAKLNQGGRSCGAVVKEQFKSANVFTLDVKSVQVNGSQATAEVSSKFDGHDQLRRLRLRKQGQVWRVVSMS